MMKLLCVIFLVTRYVILSSSQLSSDAVNGCREPSNITEMYRTLRVNAIETAGILQDDSATEGVHPYVTITTLNHTCPHTSQSHHGICNCSSRHELNFDPTRIPKALVQTSCCSENIHITSWVSKCKEVYHNIKVLRRTSCVEGVFRYTAQNERVPIGCSCYVIPNEASTP